MNDKVTAIEDKRMPEVEIQNSLFEIFIPGSGASNRLAKLKEQLTGKAAFDLLKFCKKIQGSPAYQAYVEKRQEILEAEQKKQEGKANIMINAMTVPAWGELMMLDSGLKIEKFPINISDIPDWDDPVRALNANDMEMLEVLFEFV